MFLMRASFENNTRMRDKDIIELPICWHHSLCSIYEEGSVEVFEGFLLLRE
jgi:hypothetical protein